MRARLCVRAYVRVCVWVCTGDGRREVGGVCALAHVTVTETQSGVNARTESDFKSVT